MKRHTELLLDKAKHAIQAAEVLRDADQIDLAAGRLYYAMFTSQKHSSTTAGSFSTSWKRRRS
ncbi:MAG: hypothetical protein ACOC92_01060 [bacterium]